MAQNKTTIINLYGGPGSGKSTSAAYLFYLLKIQGANVELVREYVKNWAWEGRAYSEYDQVYFLGKHIRHESLLYNKVNWIVTDYPVFMSVYYARKHCPKILSDGIEAMSLAYYQQAEAQGHKHIHIFLNRNKPYMEEGRYQKEAEAKAMDQEIKSVLDDMKVSYLECTPDELELVKALANIKDKQS